MEFGTKVYKRVYFIYQVLGTTNNKIHNKQIIILMTSALFHDAVGINMLFSPKFWCKIENAIFLEPKVPRRWLTPHWIGITGLLSEIIMKNAYHAMIFAYVSTFLAILCKNAIITDDVINDVTTSDFHHICRKPFFYPLLTIVQI